MSTFQLTAVCNVIPFAVRVVSHEEVGRRFLCPLSAILRLFILFNERKLQYFLIFSEQCMMSESYPNFLLTSKHKLYG